MDNECQELLEKFKQDGVTACIEDYRHCDKCGKKVFYGELSYSKIKTSGVRIIHCFDCGPIKNKEKKEMPTTKQKDNVDHPSHYTDGKIEVIDFIEDKKLNYHRGNAIKYISRAGKKDKKKEIEDLQKAVWYLNREIERLKQAN